MCLCAKQQRKQEENETFFFRFLGFFRVSLESFDEKKEKCVLDETETKPRKNIV